MMTMRKLSTQTLTGDGTSCQFTAGTFTLAPHTNAVAARFKVRMQLTKAAGDAALTDAQRRTLLEGFDLSLSYGANQQHKPFSKTNWSILRDLVAYGFGSEIEGFDDSTDGLAKTIGVAATDVAFYLRVPFAALAWQDPAFTKFWTVGPTQAKTMVFDFRRLTPTLPANFALSGSVYVDMIPDEVPCAEDRWTYIPEYREQSETDRFARRLPDGLTALLIERTAVHASTTMTDVGLRIRDYEAYDKVTLAEVITRYRDPQAYFPSEADISDRYTLLWAISPGVTIDMVPAGKPVFVQHTHSLATLALSTWYHPHVADSAIEADVLEMARIKGRTINVVSGYQALGKKLPKTLQFACPLVVYEQGDKEFERYAGLAAAPGAERPVLLIPETLANTVVGRVRAKTAAQEYAGAEDDVQQLALSVPGAGHPAGLKGGSPVLDRVRAALA